MKIANLAFALTLFVASGALAQSGPPSGADRRPEPPRFSAQDQMALLDARIAALKAGLQLTPEQEKNWPAVEAALRDNEKVRSDRIDRFRRTRGEASDPATRLRRAAEVFSARAAELNRLADAVDPLSKSLDDGQRRRLAVLMRDGGGGNRWSNDDRRRR